MAKLRTRKHRVVLSRSTGGDFGINLFLILMGTFMFLPMLYVIMQSMKPLDELWMFPPRFYVEKPTGANFGDLFTLMSDNYVPFSRYIFNTVFVSVTGTSWNLPSVSSLIFSRFQRQPQRSVLLSSVLSKPPVFSTLSMVRTTRHSPSKKAV